MDGLSYREIARLLGRNVSTVSRELRRNCTHMYDIPTYYPHTAQKKYLLRRSYCHRGMFRSQGVIEYINEKLRATWSPEQIACTPCELKMPSWRTIYRWIYEKYLVNGNLKVLRRKGKSHGSNAIVSVLPAFPSQLVKTITCDRGAEFANWRKIEERLHCDVYFADPYCAWQKGTNENLNGLLREFYPKGRNLSRVAPSTQRRKLALINARPRKVLNFHSPQELWDFELSSCCT